MVRLFTVPFYYKEQTYTAVVCLTQCGGKHTTTIHLPDESLHPILGDRSVSFDAEKGLPINTPNFTPAQELLVCILMAIEQMGQQMKGSPNEHQSL